MLVSLLNKNCVKYALNLIKMAASSSSNTNTACCSSGSPKLDGAYSPKGSVFDLTSDVKAYQVGEKANAQLGIVLIYDIFGLDVVNTKRFADMLSGGYDDMEGTSDDRSPINVIMPDFFKQNPWPLEKFPPSDFNDLIKWVWQNGNYVDHVRPILMDAIARLKQTWSNDITSSTSESKKHIAVVGLCWGGHHVLESCADAELGDIGAGIALHGSFMSAESASKTRTPLMMIPAGDDPPIDPIKEALDKTQFASQCEYYRFEAVGHGYAAARGDWENPEGRKAMQQACSLTRSFLRKHLNSATQ